MLPGVREVSSALLTVFLGGALGATVVVGCQGQATVLSQKYVTPGVRMESVQPYALLWRRGGIPRLSQTFSHQFHSSY